VLRAIQQDGEDKISGAVARLQLSLPAELEGQLRDNDIRDALKEAYYFTIAKDIGRETRLRLGEKSAEEIAPLEALKTYLETNYPPERVELLLEYGEKLITGEETEEE
jgi:exonuclease SbcD